MRQIDKIRNTCIDSVETQYASRMEKLVNELRLEDAESILSEIKFKKSYLFDLNKYLINRGY